MKLRIVSSYFLALVLAGATPRVFGQASGQSQPASLYDFGTHDIGTKSAPIAVTLKNPANVKVKFTITPDKSSKPDYQIEKNECGENIAPGASCEFDITFSPMGEGERPAGLVVTYQADTDGKPTTLPSVTLRGIGSLPDLGVSSTQLCFPAQQLSTTSTPQTVTLTNNSSNELTIKNIFVSGDFLLEAPASPLLLRSKESAVAVVTFKPVHEGSASGMLTIFSSAKGSPQDVRLSGNTAELLSELCSARPLVEILLVLVLCLSYWLAMVVVRWNRVARPTRELLKAEINSLQAELDTVSVDKKSIAAAKITGLLTNAKDLIDKEDESRSTKIANFIFWSRGQEITGWSYIHEAEIQMTPLLADETVTARLETNEQQLRVVNDAPSLALANAIHQELTTATLDKARRKALLAEALNVNYQRGDDSFADLVSWQNKTAWLVACGLVLIVVLTRAISHHSILFLVGATGGLLSRLSRSLDRKDVPTDYGASWTTLFLSPVAGALGAWAGILLSGLAVKINVLGSVFQADWSTTACQPTTLAIAFVFGFSERLLDGVLDKLVEKSGSSQATATNPQPPQKTTSGGQDTNSNPAGGSSFTIPDQILPNGKVEEDYSAQLQISGASGNVIWSPQPGSYLPTGLLLSPDGKITGRPTNSGSFPFTVEASSQGAKQIKVLTIVVDPGA
jgi:hypothetical protein